jgi:hypothetical protein
MWLGWGMMVGSGRCKKWVAGLRPP